MRTRRHRAFRQADPLGVFARIHAEVVAGHQENENARQGAARAAPVVSGESAPPARLCAVCGLDLEQVDRAASNPNGERVYCSSRCRQKAYRERRREQGVTAT